MPRVNDIYIEDGEIAFRNFRGNPERNYDHSNKRTVTFKIPEEIKDDLINDGWNVKTRINKDYPDDPPTYLLEATVCFRTRDGKPKDPQIFIVRPDRLIHVTEETVDTLDGLDIVSVDARLGPKYWEQGNRKGIRAYVNKMLITIEENPIDKKYREMVEERNNLSTALGDDLGDLPFPIE